MKKVVYYNTLDIDNNDKEFVEMVLTKVKNNFCLIRYEIEDSLQKGMHIKLFCGKVCENCRMVFDDINRFKLDEYRPIHSRNVLFDKKEFYP